MALAIQKPKPMTPYEYKVDAACAALGEDWDDIQQGMWELGKEHDMEFDIEMYVNHVEWRSSTERLFLDMLAARDILLPAINYARANWDSRATDFRQTRTWDVLDFYERCGRCRSADGAIKKLKRILWDPYRKVLPVCPDCNMESAPAETECSFCGEVLPR